MARGGAAGFGTFYGREAFSPWRILMQVGVIQLVLYLSNFWVLTLLDQGLSVSSAAYSNSLALVCHQMFDYRLLSLQSLEGQVALAAFCFSMVVCCPLVFTQVVGRSKRALDYAVTIVLGHFLVCTAFGGFPSSNVWWFTVLSTTALMTVLSEVMSRREELREIAVSTRDIENPAEMDDEDAIRPA